MEEFILYSVIMLWCFQFFFLFAIFLLFRQFGEVYLNSGEGISRDGLSVGKQIPEFKAYSMTQKKHVESNQLITKATIIAFVSHNCKPCQELISDWNVAYNDYREEVDFLMIVLGEEREITSVLQNKAEGEILWDELEDLFYRFKVRVTPFAFAVNQNGIVLDKGLCGSKEQIDLFVSSVLQDDKGTDWRGSNA